MKQTFHNKGDSTDQYGARTTGEPEFNTFEFTGTGLLRFPVTTERPTELSIALDTLARRYSSLSPENQIGAISPTTEVLERAKAESLSLRRRMIALQEEMDWFCYRAYGLVSEDLCYHDGEVPEVDFGERAFEIVLARTITGNVNDYAWFKRHRATPIDEIPDRWPARYRALVEKRIDIIESNPRFACLKMECTSVAGTPNRGKISSSAALRNWLLDRLESTRYWPAAESQAANLQSVAELADKAQPTSTSCRWPPSTADAMISMSPCLSVNWWLPNPCPSCPSCGTNPPDSANAKSGNRFGSCERRQDAGESVGDIPVPPKYTSADFLKTDSWQLRGKLDVPKERWVSYPHCETESDPSLVVGWAGWNHLQQATALIAYYDARKSDGWDAKRLTPLLAGLDQLLPWIHQWHPDVDPEFGETAGQSYETLLKSDAHELGLTVEDLRAWEPPAKGGPRKRRKEEGEEGTAEGEPRKTRKRRKVEGEEG
jgi:hypothetical protein